EQFILWDLKSGQSIKTFKSPGHVPNCLSVDWQKMVAATGSDDGLVKLWDLESGECTKTIDCDHHMTLALDVDWEKRRLLTGSWDHQVKLFDLDTGEILKWCQQARRTMTQVRLKK
ncbi:unnamed protein product, partial [Polarella glacialis]